MKTVTITVQLKEWARYYAQDGDGNWWQFSHQPAQGRHGLGYWIVKEGKFTLIAEGPSPADWTKEIYEVIRE